MAMNMKRVIWMFASLFLLASCGLALGQTDKATEHFGAGQVLDVMVANAEREIVPAADAMPESKYSFAPTGGEFKGVRTFAEQVKHLAAANYQLGAHVLGERPPHDEQGEKGPGT